LSNAANPMIEASTLANGDSSTSSSQVAATAFASPDVLGGAAAMSFASITSATLPVSGTSNVGRVEVNARGMATDCSNTSEFQCPLPGWTRLQQFEHGLTESSASGAVICFNDYKSWDLVLLTQRYLQYLVHVVADPTPGAGGLLVHCISGWDRTPLFISLLRLSLWADGRAHASFSPLEMLYFTVGYDWFLFGYVAHA
jgi:hypothetical protein